MLADIWQLAKNVSFSLVSKIFCVKMSGKERKKQKFNFSGETSKLKTVYLPQFLRFMAMSTSTYCFFTFYNECTLDDVNTKCSLAYIAFIVTFANAFAGLPPFSEYFCFVLYVQWHLVDKMHCLKFKLCNLMSFYCLKFVSP